MVALEQQCAKSMPRVETGAKCSGVRLGGTRLCPAPRPTRVAADARPSPLRPACGAASATSCGFDQQADVRDIEHLPRLGHRLTRGSKPGGVLRTTACDSPPQAPSVARANSGGRGCVAGRRRESELRNRHRVGKRIQNARRMPLLALQHSAGNPSGRPHALPLQGEEGRTRRQGQVTAENPQEARPTAANRPPR